MVTTIPELLLPAFSKILFPLSKSATATELKLIEVSFVQLLNASFSILLTDVPSFNDFIPVQSAKAETPIFVIQSVITRSAIEVQFLKASLSIDLTPLKVPSESSSQVKSIFVSLVQSEKALLRIFSTLVGTDNVTSELHPLKA